MRNTFTCECGEVLYLRPVNMMVAGNISRKMIEYLNKEQMDSLLSEDLTTEQAIQLFGENIGIISSIGDRLFNYCAGWGVENDPPTDDGNVELMNLLGVSPSNPHLYRAEWVRSLMGSEEEAQLLVKAVMGLSNRQPVSEDDDKDALIARLQAKLDEANASD